VGSEFEPVESDTDQGRINFTLRVAVTGHRTLLDEERIGDQVDEAVDRLLRTLPIASDSLTEIRLVVISALAEGADRLVAHRMMKRGAELEVVLPLEADDYKEDFGTVESRTRFDDLCEAARLVTVISSVDDRELAYRQVGRALVDHCDVLIAVWDGQPPHRVGGTADTVGYARERGVPFVWIATDGTQRMTPQIGDSPVDWSELSPLSVPGFKLLEEFNRSVHNKARLDRLAALLARQSLETAESAIVGPVRDAVKWIAPYYARATHRANLYQRWFLLVSTTIVVLAFSAVALVGAQLVFFRGSHYYLIWIEVGTLSLMMLGLLFGRLLRLHHQWITSRYLGESLRSALFLAVVGISEGRDRSDSRTSETSPTDAWLRRAYAEVWSRRPRVAPDDHHAGLFQRFLADNWIHDQVRYHQRRAERCERQDLLATIATWVLLGLSLVAAILHAVKIGKLAVGYAAIILPAGIAAVGTFTAQREYRQHARRYGEMTQRLAECERRMYTAESLRRVQELALETEAVMRHESGEWFGVVRLHNLEPA